MSKIRFKGEQKKSTHLQEKLRLRMDVLPDAPLLVVDAFSADEEIWSAIRRQRKFPTKVIRIEKGKDHCGFFLWGDNLKFLPEIVEHAKPDAVDLDAYGVPFAQMQLLRDLRYSGMVFATAILSKIASLPNAMLRDLEISDAMIRDGSRLITYQFYDLILEWLNKNGATDIRAIRKEDSLRKMYLSYRLN
ncbi:MAG: hypothetical protein KGJ13_04385 [Patescibacteria group bacterium]|nr:hypothetical protein [Patescibacteria group bacterium]